MFPTTDGPRFHRGTGILLGLSSTLIVFAALNSAYLYWRNQQKERILLERAGMDRHGDGSFEGSMVDGKGDESVHFRYIT